MDKAIYEFVDRWAAYFQKHHGWNLLAVRVYLRGGMLVSSTGFFLMARSMEKIPGIWTTFTIINAAMLFLLMQTAIKTHERLGDYPENKTKCDTLNVLTVIERETHRTGRTMHLVLCISLLPLVIWPPIIISDICWVIWVIQTIIFQYVECCLFLGPGQHSKELDKKEIAEGVHAPLS